MHAIPQFPRLAGPPLSVYERGVAFGGTVLAMVYAGWVALLAFVQPDNVDPATVDMAKWIGAGGVAGPLLIFAIRAFDGIMAEVRDRRRERLAERERAHLAEERQRQAEEEHRRTRGDIHDLRDRMQATVHNVAENRSDIDALKHSDAVKSQVIAENRDWMEVAAKALADLGHPLPLPVHFRHREFDPPDATPAPEPPQ